MTTETETASTLLRDLAASFVEHPEDLSVAFQDSLDGATYFALKGNKLDDPLLVGAGGSHVDALTHLVARFGAAAGRPWTFRLITEEGRSERANRAPRDVLSYNPEPARDLLVRILEALEVGSFKVAVGPGSGPRHSLSFAFDVSFKDPADARVLLKTHRTVIRAASDRGPERAIEMSDVQAIGTLFRAAAKRDGVRFQVTVVKT